MTLAEMAYAAAIESASAAGANADETIVYVFAALGDVARTGPEGAASVMEFLKPRCRPHPPDDLEPADFFVEQEP